jgi:hypothetical protein
MFPLQKAISTTDESSADLQWTEGEGFVCLWFVEIVTQLAIYRTDEGEKKGV